ncbi:hypothetical protein VCHENC02_4977A, partial [Vibrio harveyi]
MKFPISQILLTTLCQPHCRAEYRS